MSDNLRRYRAIRDGLRQLYPRKLTGRQAQHLETLARFVSGIVASQRCDLPSVARTIPGQATACPKRSQQVHESTVKQLTRWLQHPGIDRATYYLPFAKAVVKALAKRGWITFVIDGSEVGRGCRALVVSAVYGHRALPIAWIVEKGGKGHFSDAEHTALLTRVRPMVPAGTKVMLLGDGEFDGIGLLGAVSTWGWHYVCRTARNTQLFEAEPFHEEGFSFHEVNVSPGGIVELPHVTFTAERFGPVLAVAAWDAVFPDPLYLVTNLDVAEEALWWYRKRPRIETFFSDQKPQDGNGAHQTGIIQLVKRRREVRA